VGDERGGALGRVCCIGGCAVRAAKQWVPEDSSKIEIWLAQRDHNTLWFTTRSGSPQLHPRDIAAGSSARTAAEGTAFCRNDIIGAASCPEGPGQRRTTVLSTNGTRATDFLSSRTQLAQPSRICPTLLAAEKRSRRTLEKGEAL
jgi:hypothetical protein